jgi:hypothetical protein
MKEFWVVYDYGMGGGWALARAESQSEIARTFPELKVVDEKPEWMTQEIERKLRTESSFAVGDPRTYPKWLRDLIDERDE